MTDGSMYQTYKANAQKCLDTKSDLHIALSQIRSTPLGPDCQAMQPCHLIIQ